MVGAAGADSRVEVRVSTAITSDDSFLKVTLRRQIDAPKTALVLGGNSDIAHAVMRRLVIDGLSSVVLAVRDTAALYQRLEQEPLPLRTIKVVEWNALDSRRPLAADGQRGVDFGQY